MSDPAHNDAEHDETANGRVRSIALLAVRVLTHQGHNDTAPDDLRPHLEEISARYRELKRTTDFMTSAEIARTEWLVRYMTDNI
jgi:hypothetical protein